jgi:outer membrane lipoprotein SlyB
MKARLISAAAMAIALSACATGPGHDRSSGGYDNSSANQCRTCGTVDRIEQIHGDRHSTGTGAVLGGVVGGVLGNQVGKGNGKTAATVVGVVAGAAVGNEIEKNQNGSSFDIYVRMDDGRRLILNQRDLGGIEAGSYVSVENNRARLVR